ncbi:helix-turn-helix domain-containing protein [Paenibacillus sp. MCAF9]|uniref:helix-turn-helix domain-containing protein n=1 Tax=Paenibacillus sp. MCAF9 TaxID=3233046 RepID=UPI003F9A60C6
MDHLATNIRNLRKEKGLTIKELSAKAQISEPALAKIELGKQDPTWGVIKKISNALDIPVSELVRSPESLEFNHKLFSIIRLSPETDNEAYILTGTSQSTQGVEVKWGYLVVYTESTVELSENFFIKSNGNIKDPTDFFKNHLQFFLLPQRLKVEYSPFDIEGKYENLKDHGVHWDWNTFIEFIEYCVEQSKI